MKPEGPGAFRKFHHHPHTAARQEFGIRRFFSSLGDIFLGLAAFRKPGLQRITTRIHRDHLKRNPASVGLRYGAGRRLLVVVRQRWGLTLLAVVLLYAVVAIITAMFPPTAYGPQIPSGLIDHFRDLQTINLALLGAQATLLGLVYPLVIALVGMLFDTRSSSGHRLQVYFSETEAAPVGGLALTYIAAVALQSLLYGQLLLKVVGALTVLNVLWFGINLAGLAFFVVRSLQFIQPSRRAALVRSYVANTAWKVQLRDLILVNRWQNAAAYGYLPADPDASGFSITPFMSGAPLIARKLARRRQLKDIRLGVLSVALRARARRLVGEGMEGGATTITAWPEESYDNNAILICGTGAMIWSERWLFRRAFRFGRTRRVDVIPTTEALLAEGAVDLVAFFDAARFDDFRARLGETVEQHALYYQLAQVPDQPGEDPFNYAALTVGMNTLSRAWGEAYIPLLDRLAERLSGEPRFFASAAGLAARLQRRVDKAPPAATNDLFFLPMYLVRALLQNATQGRNVVPGATVEAVFRVSGADARPYGRAWQDLIGGWESFADAIAPLAMRRKERPAWSDLQRLAPGLARHLRESALMVALAARSGEITAIHWTADLMLKWDERVRRVWPTSGQRWSLDRALPTLGLLAEDWNTVAALPLGGGDPAFEPIDIYDAATQNAWLDTLVVLTCSLIALSRSPAPGVFNDGAAMAACALFQNRAADPGASYHPRSAPLATDAIIRSILRMVGHGGQDEGGYGQSMGELADRISRLEGPNYVSGRIYGWAGEASVWSQSATHGLLLAASLSPAAMAPRSRPVVTEGLRSLLLPSSDEARRDIIRHLETMRSDLASINMVHGAGIASGLTASTINEPDLGERIGHVRDLLEACLAVIAEEHDAALLLAPVDTAKLRSLSRAAQGQAFGAERGGFPLTAFRTIDTADEPLTAMTYRSSVRRGAYVSPPMDYSVSNEDEWWQAEMVGRVSDIVLLDVLNGSGAAQRRPRMAKTYWKTLTGAIEAVKAAGETPVIVRPHRQDPAFLWDWTFGKGDRPADLVFDRRPDQDDAYDFHLNGAAVYSSRAANGATWVFGLERLERVTFQTFGEEGLARMDLVPDSTALWRAELLLRWGRNVTLKPGLAFRISHPPRVSS